MGRDSDTYTSKSCGGPSQILREVEAITGANGGGGGSILSPPTSEKDVYKLI